MNIGEEVHNAFVKHYENFLGSEGEVCAMPSPDLFTRSMDPNVANDKIRPTTDKEVKGTMFFW